LWGANIDHCVNAGQLFQNVRHINAFVPVRKNDGAEQRAISVQHFGVHCIGHDELFARQREHVVEGRHEPPHIRVETIHGAKVLVQSKTPIHVVGEMMQYFGIVVGDCINEPLGGGFFL